MFDHDLSSNNGNSRRSSITSMDTEKMIRLNMEADHENEDSFLIRKKMKHRHKPNFVRKATKSLANLRQHLNDNSTYRFKMEPCYPKKLVDDYMNKFQV